MIQKSGNIIAGRETMLVELIDGRIIETAFSFYGGGVLSTLVWGEFQAINVEDLIGIQVTETEVFKFKNPSTEVGSFWKALNGGQAGSIWIPGDGEGGKIIWKGVYPNDFGYKNDIAIMEKDNPDKQIGLSGTCRKALDALARAKGS